MDDLSFPVANPNVWVDARRHVTHLSPIPDEGNMVKVTQPPKVLQRPTFPCNGPVGFRRPSDLNCNLPTTSLHHQIRKPIDAAIAAVGAIPVAGALVIAARIGLKALKAAKVAKKVPNPWGPLHQAKILEAERWYVRTVPLRRRSSHVLVDVTCAIRMKLSTLVACVPR